MGSTRALLGSVIVLAIAGLAACSAGNQNDADSDSDGKGGSDSDGNGGSMGPGFEVGGSGGGINQGCGEADCIGNSPQGNCDANLTVEGTTAMDGARAIGLCKEYVEGQWGVVGAAWVQADGTTPLNGAYLDGKGILPDFGSNMPKEGSKLLALSSGAARDPGDAGFVDPSGHIKGDGFNSDTAPPGYPKESPACPGVETGPPYDSAGLRIVVKTPRDAKSISYNLNFYTYEYPDFICDIYNDFFVAFLTPTPAGLPDPNISFDADGNLISVNAGFLQACTGGNFGGKQFGCPLGYSSILGTGFDSNDEFSNGAGIQGSAATGWLETKAPVPPSTEIVLHFAIWDSGDPVLDSTVLIDNFRFELSDAVTGTAPE